MALSTFAPLYVAKQYFAPETSSSCFMAVLLLQCMHIDSILVSVEPPYNCWLKGVLKLLLQQRKVVSKMAVEVSRQNENLDQNIERA